MKLKGFINRLRNKQNSRKGFTLVEMLIAILILLMVSSLLAAGIPTAANAYKKVVQSSNAEVALSTTITTLRNELGTSKNIEVSSEESGGKTTIITYYSESRGSASKIFLKDNNIKLQRYVVVGDLKTKESNAENLVSAVAVTGGMSVVYEEIEYDKDNKIITVKGLKVKEGDKEVAFLKDKENKPVDLSIRVI